MNNNTDHVLDSPTTEFTFCLRGDEHLEKCTSGLFSSLPMHSRQTLWNRVFGEQFETSTANNTAKSTENKNASTLTALTVTSLLVIIIVITCLLLLIFIRWKRYKKKWTRDNEITIPLQADDLENVSPLLPLETWRKLSCNSHESTSTGYASDMSDSTRSSLESLKISQKKDVYCVARDSDINLPSVEMKIFKKYKSGTEKIENPARISKPESKPNIPCSSGGTTSTKYSDNRKNATRMIEHSKRSRLDKDSNSANHLPAEASPVFKRTSAIGVEKCAVDEGVEHPESINVTPVKLRETQSYNVKKMNVIPLQSPNKTPGQDDSLDNEADPLTVEVSTATANTEASPVIKRTSATGVEECAVEEVVKHPGSINDTPVKLREIQSYNVKKMDVIHLQSPNKTSGQDDNEADPLTVEDSTATANNSDIDFMRLHWNKIFWFLIKQIIPSMYSLFFSLLLENAGCKTPSWYIENIECNQRGKTQAIVLTLLQIWKECTGTNAKPKDIEDVFETLEWNDQLRAFREYMRTPPYLPAETNWNERSWECISLESMIGDTRHLRMLQMEVPQIEGTDDKYDSLTQTNDVENFTVDVTEHVSVVNENDKGVIRRQKFRCHRSMVQNSSDHDSNDKRFNAEEVKCRSASGNECFKLCSHKLCTNRCEIVSKRGKHALLDTKVSSINNKRCTSPLGSSNISSSSSTYSSETYNNFSSGYGSMSSNSEEQNISTNTGNVTNTNTQYENAEANSQTGLLGNLVRNSETNECEHEAQTALERITDNQNENLLVGIPFVSTSNSWNVSSKGRPSLTSNVVAEPRNQKQKRNRNTKHSLGIKRKMVSKKRRKSDRRKRTTRKNRKLSGDDDLKSFYISSLFETFIIEDLLARMTPSREDILSLKFHSYLTANCFVTTWNEEIHTLFSEKHSLSVGQAEWEIIQKYVKKVRKGIKTKRHDDWERDFLFLNHAGKPLM